MCTPNVCAILCASNIEGLYFPLSSEMIVWRNAEQCSQLLLRHALRLAPFFNTVLHRVTST